MQLMYVIKIRLYKGYNPQCTWGSSNQAIVTLLVPNEVLEKILKGGIWADGPF